MSTEGRVIRWAEVDGQQAGKYSNAVEDIYEDRLDALVLRGAFPGAVAAAVAGRVAADRELPWLRPNRAGPNADIRVLGVAATPTFETPGGPAVDAYFDAADRYHAVTRDLLGSLDVDGFLEATIGRISGGRPVQRLVDEQGRRFARCTLRSLPEGQSIIVHNDYFHFQLPVYAEAVAHLDTTISLSFLAVLQAPEQGGELVVHGLAHDEETPRTPEGLPDGAAIAERYRCWALPAVAGDVIVFGAGKYYHHVEPVRGPIPRITLGGFLAFDRERRSVVYWN